MTDRRRFTHKFGIFHLLHALTKGLCNSSRCVVRRPVGDMRDNPGWKKNNNCKCEIKNYKMRDRKCEEKKKRKCEKKKTVNAR